MLDVVPSLCGLYDDLVDDATPLQVGPHSVLVASPTSVLDRLDRTARKKDRARVDEIDRVRRHVDRGTHRLTGLDHLITQ